MLPNTFSLLMSASDQTLDVNCKKLINEFETYAEYNMRCTISNVRRKRAKVIAVDVNYGKFEEYNKQYESRDCYDKEGNPNLTYREAGLYEVTDTLYFDENSNPNDYFSLIPSSTSSLQTMYMKEKNVNETYIQWLERTLTELL